MYPSLILCSCVLRRLLSSYESPLCVLVSSLSRAFGISSTEQHFPYVCCYDLFLKENRFSKMLTFLLSSCAKDFLEDCMCVASDRDPYAYVLSNKVSLESKSSRIRF
jgi:hypothetical protein